MVGTKSGTVSIRIKRRNKMEIDKELAQYIADYIREELSYERSNTMLVSKCIDKVDTNMIMSAVDAFDGGAR